MLKYNNSLFIAILFTLVGFSAYVAGLFIDVTRDAGLYATISKEVFENGNLINLTIHNEPYDQKPPLLFWLGALGFLIGEVSNFWFKLPVFILVVAGIYWGFRLGRSLYNRKTGIVTAVLLSSSFIYSLYSMDIHTDTPLQAFVTLALWQLYEFIKTGKNKNWILGFVAIGLAMLSKGPVGAAIPAFAVIGHIVLKKDFKKLLDYRWYAGIIIALLVASPAIIGLMNQFGWKGIQFFFWENMVGRITGSYVQAENDPIFYVHNLLYQLLPWSLIFFIAVFFEFKHLLNNKFKSVEYFSFSGIWIYFIIINSASSQLPNYVFSIIPLMGVLVSKWIVIAAEGTKSSYKMLLNVLKVTVGLFWIAIAFISLYLFPSPQWYFWLISVGGLLSVWYIYKHELNKLLKLIVPPVIVSFILMFLMNFHVFPYVFSYQATAKAARYVNEYAEKDDVLFDYNHRQHEMFFYSTIKAVQLKNFEEAKDIAGKKGHWVFTNHPGLDDLLTISAEPDTIIHYRHLSLNRPAKFINPSTREEALEDMYLVKY